MWKRNVRQHVRAVLVAAVVVCAMTPAVYATNANSNNYKITETQIGGGSTTKTCSGQYCAQVSIGDVSGNAGSSAGTAKFATNTDSEPRLELILDPGESKLGVLKPDQTATKTATMRVNNYLVGGYQIVISGDPPKIDGHTFSTSSTPAASVKGSEQFGINLAANSTPGVGVAPVQVPSGSVTFGQASTGYNTANLFKYVSGDTIAESSAKSGRTDYTISFILNISNATPSGHYTGQYSVIAIPAY